MPRVPDFQLQQSLAVPGDAEGVSRTMLSTVQAATGVAGNLLDAGQTVVKTLKRQQQIEDRKTALDARLGMQANLAEFERSLEGVDPKEWVSRFDENAQQYKSQFLAQDYPPNVRRELELEANQAFGRARIQIAGAALKKNVGLTRQKYGQEIDLLTKRGETAAAKARLDEAKNLGIIDDPDYDAQAQQIDAFEQITGLHDLILDHPYKTLKTIQAPDFLKKFPALTLADQAELESVATRAINADRAQFWEAAVEAANNPDNPKILTDEELSTLADQGQITQTQRAKYLEAYRPDTAQPFDPAIYQKAITMIRGYTPENDPDGFEAATIRETLSNLNLPTNYRRELGKRFTAHLNEDATPTRSGKKIRPNLRPIEKHFADLHKKYLEAGKFGGWINLEDHDQDESTAPKEVIDLKAYNRANALAIDFQTMWENHLANAPEDYPSTQAALDFETLYQDFRSKGPSPFEMPSLPPPVDFDKRLRDLIGDEGAKGTPGTPGTANTDTAKANGPTYHLGFSTYPKRQAIFRAGGTPILLDTNFSTAEGGIAHPLMVIPDEATQAQRDAAQAYVDRVAKTLNSRFGRQMKGRVVTRSENGRGRAYAFHTEPFALSDRPVARFMATPEGLETHRQIIRETLAKAPGAQFFLPHSPTDPGATVGNQSEVSMARELLRGFSTDLPPAALTAPRPEAQTLWHRTTRPTSPAEIREGLDELDTLRAIHKHSQQ